MSPESPEVASIRKSGCFTIDARTLYTAHHLKEHLPRSLFVMIRGSINSPVTGFYWGAAVIQVLDNLYDVDCSDGFHPGRDEFDSTVRKGAKNDNEKKGRRIWIDHDSVTL